MLSKRFATIIATLIFFILIAACVAYILSSNTSTLQGCNMRVHPIQGWFCVIKHDT